ncbi:MAG: sodium ion-translocating decarboxylase subunit beta, partial [Dehalococcoidales bacterium]|nr:sodium ion-translocating decarboxylase subunit beta [Dehalococcoidales bacterium]
MSWSDIFSALVSGFSHLTWQSGFLILVGCVLLYLAIAKGMEPLLLIPIGFGVILGNLPLAGLAASDEGGVLNIIYKAGILTEIFPCLIFVGLGAMIDFGPMLANPSVLIFGAAGQFGIFITLLLALSLGFARQEAVSIAVIGACDGPTAIYVTSKYAPQLLPAVSIAAYSYMSLVPIIQPPIMRLLTTKKERAIVMPYGEKKVSKRVKVLFPIVAGLICMLIAPMGAPLMGMLMLGNLLKESGVVGRLADVSSGALVNIVTLLLGICIGSAMLAGNFLQWQTILVFILGLVAISLDTVAGVLLGKLMRVISKGKINPLIGAAGTSAFPMSSRVVQKEGQKANPRSFLLWHAIGANTGGQIGSVMAASVMLAILAGM